MSDTQMAKDRHRLFPNTPDRVIPILDGGLYVDTYKKNPKVFENNSNMDQWFQVAISKTQGGDALFVIKNYSTRYLSIVFSGVKLFFAPSNRWFAPVSHGKPTNKGVLIDASIYNIEGKQVVGQLMLFIMFCVALYSGWLHRDNIAVLFMTVTMLYVLVITTPLEIGENMRFRFNIDPFMWVLCGLFINKRMGVG